MVYVTQDLNSQRATAIATQAIKYQRLTTSNAMSLWLTNFDRHSISHSLRVQDITNFVYKFLKLA